MAVTSTWTIAPSGPGEHRVVAVLDSDLPGR